MTRILLVSGKGGVGKTTVATATALACSRRGHRTLVLSLDLAHSLSDSLDLDRSLFNLNAGLPAQVAPNLDVQEIDVPQEIERNWGEVYRFVASLLMSTGLANVVAEEVAIAPGMEDIIALMYLNEYVKAGSYDVIVVDCPPTSESLRFVGIYSTLEWYMRKRFRFDRNLMKLARPIATRLTDMPVPEDSYFDALQRLFSRLDGVDELLADPKVTSVRLVTNAEKMVLRETQRAFMYFCLYGINTDLVVINRLFSTGEGYYSRWAATQASYSEATCDHFQPVPVAKLPLFPDEVVGAERLAELAAALYGDDDPARFYLQAPPYAFSKQDGLYRLTIQLPFARRDEVDLRRHDEDLLVRVGSFKRHVPLPRAVARLRTGGARIEEGRLVVEFVEEGQAPGAPIVVQEIQDEPARS